jgi:hypothetical protein
MRKLAGQAGWVIGKSLHAVGLLVLTAILVLGLAIFAIAFRLSLGPIQLPYLASALATAASGQGITIHVGQAALAWGGYRQGGAAPLYLRLGQITASNSSDFELAEVPDARLIFLPSALLGSKAPILVNSADAHFAGSDVAVSLLAAIRLGIGFHLSSADLFVTLGGGQLGSPGNSMPITGGGFSLHLTPHYVALANGDLTLAPYGASAPVVKFFGAGQRDGVWHGALTITVDAVRAPDLATYWPAGLVQQTRYWVTHNITAGAAHDGKFVIGLTAPANLARLDIASASGGFTGTNLTLNWIPNAHPITDLNGTLTLLSPDALLVSVTSAKLATLSLSDGSLKISGMTKRLQIGAISVAAGGTVAGAIAVLNAPPLSLLRAAPAQLAQATGAMTATATATLPLKNDLTVAEVDLDLRARLTAVAVPTPIGGLAFSSGNLTLRASTTALNIGGTARLGGQDATVAAVADFLAPPVLRSFTMKTVLGTAFLHQYGLDEATDFTDAVRGNAPLDLAITGSPTGETAVLNADLTEVRLGVPAFGWSKPAGSAGTLALQASLDNDGGFGSLTSVRAAAPGLDIEGTEQNGALVIGTAHIGGTAAHGEITPGGGKQPWRMIFAGPSLSVRAILNPPPKAAAGKAAAQVTPGATKPTGPKWQVTLDFAKFRLAEAPAPILQNFHFDGSGQGGAVLTARALAESTTGLPVRLTIAAAPGRASRRNTALTAADGGALLRALGAFDDLQGGGLDLTAQYGNGEPFDGTVELRQFRLLQAPAFGKVLQGLTIYGVGEATSGPGLEFDRLIAPFSIAHGVLRLREARAYSASLGFTASGTIALADGSCDLRGTVIPAYAINALPGKIPVIGKLFTAEKGGGLFAVRVSVSGLLADPQVSVNPLSALTPGVLRDVFGAAGGAK